MSEQPTHKVSIIGDGPLSHRVIVDGVDLSHGLSGLSLMMNAGHVPELALDVRLIEVTELKDVEAKVILHPGTHEVLVALGWTPPEETSE